MKKLVIPQPDLVTLPILGIEEFFPVRRIYCIGRNYADHAIEMGFDPKEDPFFFQKNSNNIDLSGTFTYPRESEDVHHEVEMYFALKSGGSNILEKDAQKHIFGFGIGIDMTRRDLQANSKKMGRPWEIGKAFEKSAPMGPITKIEDCGMMERGGISLKVNGQIRQEGDLNMMIWKVPMQIAHLSRFYDIAAGDIIMTGTPAGVGPVAKGDLLEAHIEKLGRIEVKVI
jgi:fumarylpyruvate hydrolase